ncbi:hypothetical protein ACWFNE_13045 [Cellulomonas sp. NPDC055163]
MTAEEIRRRAARIQHARAAALALVPAHDRSLPRARRNAAQRTRDDRLRAAERAHTDACAVLWAEQAALFAPLERARDALLSGDGDAVEQLLVLLEADPWCTGSGYLKAEVMEAFVRFSDRDPRTVRRLQDVVVHRAAWPQRRLLRPTARLAVSMWDDGLRARIEAVATDDGTAGTAARMLLDAVARRQVPPPVGGRVESRGA